jgi:hypothetical protein
MDEVYQSLKKIWKLFGIHGHAFNYSSKPLWVIDGNDGVATAHILSPMTYSPPDVDIDGFKRVDGKPIEGHLSWWKIYDSSVEVFDKGSNLRISMVTRTAVTDKDFTKKQVKYDDSLKWAFPVQLVNNVERDKNKKIIAYNITNIGWLDPETVLELTCKGEIANARPVFPAHGQPYIRTRRDRDMFNNLETKGT